MPTRKKSGFTLIEALIALLIVIILAAIGYALVGRKLVDDDDPVRVVADNGYVEPKVESRHDIAAWRHGCAVKDDVAFKVTATQPGALPPGTVTLTVCCGDWFEGCRLEK